MTHECIVCGKEYDDIEELKEHVDRAHPGWSFSGMGWSFRGP